MRGAGSVATRGIASRSSSSAQVPWQAGAFDHRRMQLAGVPHRGVADEHLGASARMPRQLLRGAQPHVHAGGPGDDAHRLERVGGLGATARPPRAALFAQAGQHRGDVLGCRGNDASRTAISASVGRRSTGMNCTARVSAVGCTTCASA